MYKHNKQRDVLHNYIFRLIRRLYIHYNLMCCDPNNIYGNYKTHHYLP